MTPAQEISDDEVPIKTERKPAGQVASGPTPSAPPPSPEPARARPSAKRSVTRQRSDPEAFEAMMNDMESLSLESSSGQGRQLPDATVADSQARHVSSLVGVFNGP